MKIKIASEIINTENIYMVGDVIEHLEDGSQCSFSFHISQFGVPEPIVVMCKVPYLIYLSSTPSTGYSVLKVELTMYKENPLKTFSIPGLGLDGAIKAARDFVKGQPEYAKEKEHINAMREELLKYWTDNQGTIPHIK